MLFVTMLLLAAPATPSFKLAATNLTVTGVDPQKSSLYTEHLAQGVAASGVRVTTQREISAMLGVERQRQLLGCSDGQGSCMAELAAALGTDGVLLGDVARLEEGTYQVSLKVVWSRDGRPLSSFSGRAFSEPALLDVLAKAGEEMGEDLAQGDWTRLTQVPRSHTYEPRDSLQTLAVLPLVISVTAAATAVWGFIRANNLAHGLRVGQFDSARDAQAFANEGAATQTLAAAMCGVAAAGIATAAVMYFVGGHRIRTQVAFGPNGGALLFAGEW